MNIQLTVIDESKDATNSSILVSLADSAPSLKQRPEAWRVIENLGRGGRHLLEIPDQIEVSAIDPDGNRLPSINASPGLRYSVTQGPSGTTIGVASTAASTRAIEIANDLGQGLIEALLLKAGSIALRKSGVAPGQRVDFQLGSTIYFGVTSVPSQGAAAISSLLTEFSLVGLASADVVLRGGGSGPEATPFAFSMEHMTMDPNATPPTQETK